MFWCDCRKRQQREEEKRKQEEKERKRREEEERKRKERARQEREEEERRKEQERARREQIEAKRKQEEQQRGNTITVFMMYHNYIVTWEMRGICMNYMNRNYWKEQEMVHNLCEKHVNPKHVKFGNNDYLFFNCDNTFPNLPGWLQDRGSNLRPNLILLFTKSNLELKPLCCFYPSDQSRKDLVSECWLTCKHESVTALLNGCFVSVKESMIAEFGSDLDPETIIQALESVSLFTF